MRELKRDLWPTKVTINKPESVTDIEVWLGNTLGTFKNRWNVVYHHNTTDFYFKDEHDALVFSLKWS